MTTQSPLRTASGHLRIGRQGIHDRAGDLVGHELLFRGHDDHAALLGEGSDAAVHAAGRFSDQDRATSQVIAAAFVDFGIGEIGDGLPVFINLTRAFLLDELPLPFGPEGVVLEVLETIHVDAELLDGLRHLRDRGFRLAADDFGAEAERMPLLELVDVVKLDVLSLGDGLASAARRVRDVRPDLELLGEKIETVEQLEECHELDVDLYQGYWFARPVLLQTSQLSPTQVLCLRLLRALADPGSTIEHLERILTADPGLGMRVMRTASSSAVGTRRRITSLRQALVMLGPPTLSAWVMLTLMGGLGSTSRSHLVTILSRALACEELAGRLRGVDTSTAYTAGMLSAVAQVLGVEVDRVAVSADVGPTLRTALVEGTGDLGALVRASAAQDANRPGEASHWADAAGLTAFEVGRANLRGWSEAMGIVRSVLDD